MRKIKNQSAAKPERERSETIPKGSTLKSGSGRPLTSNVEGDDIVQKRKKNFLNKCKEKFGDTFDYSNINYVNYDTLICIKDLKGNEF